MSGDRNRYGQLGPEGDYGEEPPRPAVSPGKVSLTQRLVAPSRGRRAISPGKATRTSRLASASRAGAGPATAAPADQEQSLQVSTRHIHAKLRSGPHGVPTGQWVSITVTAPAGSLMPLACRMWVSPGGPPVVVDPGVIPIEPGQVRRIDIQLSGAAGRSDLVFHATGADGTSVETPVVTVDVAESPSDRDLEVPRGAVRFAGSDGSPPATKGHNSAAASRRATAGDTPAPTLHPDPIECGPTPGGATSECAFLIDIGGDLLSVGQPRYRDMSVTIEPLRYPKDTAAFAAGPIPSEPTYGALQSHVIFRPPRAGSYQAWLVLRGSDEAGRRFEQRAVLVGEAPTNAFGLIDHQAIAAYGKLSDDQAIDVMNAASSVLTRHDDAAQLIARCPSAFRGVLESLAIAARIENPPLDDKHTPEQRLQRLGAATAQLEPIAHRVGPLLQNEGWVETHYERHVREVRRKILVAMEGQRVDNTFLTHDGEVIEIPRDGDLHAEEAAFRHVFTRIAETAAILNEQAIRIGEEKLEEQIEAMQHGGPAEWGKMGRLTQVQAAANVLVAVLRLSDGEMWEEFKHADGLAAQVSTGSELVKYLGSTAAGMISLTAACTSVIAKHLGKPQMESAAAALAQQTIKRAGAAIGVIELVHDIAVLCDREAGAEKKEDAAADVLSTGTWLVGQAAHLAEGQKWIGKVAAESIGTVATSLSIALLVSYKELQLMAYLYGSARTGLASGAKRALPTLADDAQNLALASARLAKAGVLWARETNAERRAALEQVRDRANLALAARIHAFLESCRRHGAETGGAMEDPGSWWALAAQFQEFQRYRDVTDPEVVPVVAKRIIARMQWCGEHIDDLVDEMAMAPPGEALDKVKALRNDD